MNKAKFRLLCFIITLVAVNFWAAPLLAADDTSLVLSEDTPFGLGWGMTEKQVKALGATLSHSQTYENIDIFSSRKLPEQLPVIRVDSYSLLFDKKWGLQKIMMYSKIIQNDQDGEVGESQYFELKNFLMKRHGNPISISEKDDFDDSSQCFPSKWCDKWSTAFSNNNAHITLDLKRMVNLVSYISLVYEGPSWEDIVNRNNK
ncbi:hypothetical protein [Candidatus Nitrosacidococcus sp. I8]|uniref:hypothetical protein n=1 Tax=Candidatus Nitrosacidococcus sp. I8 TaxID=2942908 RepID=UPI0022260951|nr:hypothetical protein [Candidatus Nitrosacidococcus sp. I8]CAH9017681.1 hypothetical protein NURINAE_00494 [Candidatus Nitrosacidococcus sp. I8]